MRDETRYLCWDKDQIWLIKADLVASFILISIVLVFWNKFSWCYTSQTWFSTFLGKYYLYWGLFDHEIKRFASNIFLWSYCIDKSIYFIYFILLSKSMFKKTNDKGMRITLKRPRHESYEIIAIETYTFYLFLILRNL